MAETMMGGLGQLGDETQFGGFGGGADDPYMRQLLRRQAIAAALAKAGAQQQQPMTHWTQVLGSIAQQGVGAWQGRKAEEEALQYARDQKLQEREILANILRQTSGGGGGPAGGLPPAQTEGGAMPAPSPANTAPPSGGGAGAMVGNIAIPPAFAPHIRAASQEFNVPEPVLAWLGHNESGFRPLTGMTDNRPGKGYTPRGPFQFIEPTGRRFGLNTPEDFNDPAKSSRAAAQYLSELYKQKGSWEDAIAAYGTFSPTPGAMSDTKRQHFRAYASQFADPGTGVGPDAMGGGTQVAGPGAPTGAPPQQANVSANTTGPAAPQQAAPAQGGMSRERRIAMAEALVMSGNPNLARIGAMQLQIAKAIPEPNITIHNIGGQMVAVDQRTGQTVRTLGPSESFTPKPQAVFQQERDLRAPFPEVARTPERMQQERDLRAPTTVSPGQTVLGPGNQPVYTAPINPDPQFTLAPGAQRFDAQGKPIANNPVDPNASAFDRSNKLRDEWTKLSGDFRTVQDAHQKIQTSARSNSGAGDLSLLYGYMKLLDPGSTVREGEFATAAASGSLPERVQGYAQRVLSGERLPDAVRRDFVRESDNIISQHRRTYDQQANQYRDLARRYNLRPEDVVTDFINPAPGQAGPRAAPQQQGTEDDADRAFFQSTQPTAPPAKPTPGDRLGIGTWSGR